ncbi:unnamed protein product (mitochondrion) [Musa banksii]
MMIGLGRAAGILWKPSGFGDEAFWRSQVYFGPPNPATDEKHQGSVYVVTLPAFKRCLEDGPDAAEQRPRSGFPTSRETGDRRPSRGTSRPTGKTGDTREGNLIGSQRIHSICCLLDLHINIQNLVKWW